MTDEFDNSIFVHDFHSNWTGLDNRIVRDSRLDWDSLGLLLTLRSYRPGQTFSVEKIVSLFGTRAKQRSVYRLMKVLEEIGYVERTTRHVNGRLRTYTTLTDKPIRQTPEIQEPAAEQAVRNVEPVQALRSVEPQDVEASSKTVKESNTVEKTRANRARVMAERAKEEDSALSVKPQATRRIKRHPASAVEPTPPPKVNAVTLSNYFHEKVAVNYADMRALQANKAAVAGQIKTWVSEQGATYEMVRAMIDAYCDHPGFRREGVADWKLFIRGRDRLLPIAERILTGSITEAEKHAAAAESYNPEDWYAPVEHDVDALKAELERWNNA